MIDISQRFEGNAGAFICIEGTCEAVVNGRPYHLERGSMCVISPIINIVFMEQSVDFQFRYVVDKFEVFYSVIKLVFDKIVKVRLDQNPCRQLNEHEIDTFMERFDHIEMRRRQLDGATSDALIDIYTSMLTLAEQEMMMEFVSMYLKENTIAPKTASRDENVVFEFVFRLNKEFREHRTVEYYAEKAHLSVGHFSRIVKNHTGQTCSHWIATVTTVNAKSMLKQPDKSIKEVAAELGFPEQFTFRKYFKQHTGLSPRAYRQQYIEK